MEFSDTVVTAVNALQETAWQVNVDVLDVVRAVADDEVGSGVDHGA